MSDTHSTQDKRSYRIIIVGSGFGGLCAAIKLKAAGEHDFVILERASDVGGTWRDNDYPGCACDVQSVLYSLSFEQNPDWSRRFPSQPELYAYLQNVARKYELLPHVRFGHSMEHAAFDEGAKVWRIDTNEGAFTAPIFISAVGGLAEPATPALPGIASFEGKQFHSAQWDHTFDLSGKRVAVIGTGASAIQIVPAIAPLCGQVDVYQRTAPWVAPRKDKTIRPWMKALRRTPLKWFFRGLVYGIGEMRSIGMTRFPGILRLLQQLLILHIKREIEDPELRAKVIPDYTMGCKRILISDDWYPTLLRPNVAVITEGIAEIQPHGILSQDNIYREADAIVFATGFYATDNPVATKIQGRGGQRLSEAWSEGEEAYLGTLIHGYPNLFFITGPNTGIGHTSLVFMIESQVHFILACLGIMTKENVATLEVSAEAQRRFNTQLQQRMGHTVWASGCKSWYQNKSGKITTLWPGFTFNFRRKLRSVRRKDLELRPASEHFDPAATAPNPGAQPELGTGGQ